MVVEESYWTKVSSIHIHTNTKWWEKKATELQLAAEAYTPNYQMVNYREES